jgi:beta-lactamase superfamily II metal-dependent hydrolase
LSGSELAERPHADEVEVSVFGPGYGECVVLHLTNNQWVVIDSCLDGGSAQPTALKYLTSLAVDLATDVRLILATHYHDDHIAGIGELLEQCIAARFACSMALNSADWTKLTEIYRGYLVTGGSGVDEIRRVMRELKRRAEKREVVAPIFCIAGRTLGEPLLTAPALLACLCPSDAAVAAMHARIREKLLPRARRRRLAVPSLESNDGSVVLAIRVGCASALLGADLEERNRPGLGWQAVLQNHPTGAERYDGFKVPHHGSSTAFHPDVWNRLIGSNGWAVVTPYNRQREPIPTRTDCERIRRMTERSFITSPPGWSRFRHPSPAVQKTAEEATVKIGAEQPRYGHVRLRKSATTAGDWRIECFGHATPLAQVRIAA